MSDDFLEALSEHLIVVYRPEEMTDEEWEAWREELRAGFGEDPGPPVEEAPPSDAPF